MTQKTPESTATIPTRTLIICPHGYEQLLHMGRTSSEKSLAHPYVTGEISHIESYSPPKPSKNPQQKLEEAIGLAHAIHLDVRTHDLLTVKKIRPATFLGGGQLDMISGLIEEHEADLIFIDAPLSPTQQRNLERLWQRKVIDRTGLILEIFGARARTHEGRLQVQLAAMTYQRSRLVRSWTHLERQQGGHGVRGGPGERQIELDRRLLDDRIKRLQTALQSVKRTRHLHRKSREKVPYPVIALVGYTNAGKTSLFNRLTGAQMMAKDMLFATLDPTMRAVRLDNGHDVILSDTVGFISNLPIELVAAFHATLEDVESADIILHVRDIHSDESMSEKQDVEEVLNTMNLKEGVVMIEVLNKIDLLKTARHEKIVQDINRQQRQELQEDIPKIMLSALKNKGIKDLMIAIKTALKRNLVTSRMVLSPQDNPEFGAAYGYLHRLAHHVETLHINEETGEHTLDVEWHPHDYSRYQSRFGDS